MRLAQRVAKALSSLVLAVVGVLAFCGVARANIYNFDMTSLTPGPAYDSVILTIPGTQPTEGGSGSLVCDVFDQLNGAGADVEGCAFLGTFAYSNPEMLDGVFSIDLEASGVFVVTGDPSVVGVRADVSTGVLVGAIPGAVPEPEEFALLGLGVAAIGLARRKSTR